MVFLVKENRSFDNLFGRYPGANGATSGKLKNGKTIPLSRGLDVLTPDIGHDYYSAVTAIEGPCGPAPMVALSSRMSPLGVVSVTYCASIDLIVPTGVPAEP